jgi:hypothetical protein
MLVMALGMMVASWAVANRARTQEAAIEDKSGTATVTDEPEPMLRDESAESEAMVHAVELSRLSDFQDHARAFEPESYYYLLDLARRNPPKWLDEHARRDVTWAHLFRDPDKYRGQLIFLKGRLRRLVEDDAGENEYGFVKRYEGWLYTDEGGQYPYAVIVSDPPTGMPLGSIYEWVSVSGYFLGWYRYTSQEGKPHAAPILLGRRFHWHQQPPVRPDIGLGLTGGLIAAAIAAIGLIVFAYLALRKQPTPAATSSEPSSDSLVFEELPADRDTTTRID